MIREEIKNLIEKAIKNLYQKEVEVKIDRPEGTLYGDFATNVAMILKKNPQEIADVIKSDILEKIEIKNGFINFFISKDYLQKQVKEILKGKDKYGEVHPVKSAKGGAKQFNRVNIEFISANPTGPLTLGNGRGGFCGDVLSNILAKAGYKVEKEYYINDIGEQIKKLGHSIIGDSGAVYKGPYIEELRKKINSNNPDEVGKAAAKIILEEMIKPAVKKMGIKFDKWFYESDLSKKGEVDKILEELEKKNLAYKKDSALWFKSSQFGDDKDRVLIKEDGEKTYLTSDIAYFKNKFRRGFDKLIYLWGADHYGYIGRIKAAAEALGFKKEQMEMIIMQLVRLLENGKEVRMAKRTGIYVTIDELIDEVGVDIARFFFLTRSPDTHLNFDLDLAKEQSEKNPVYYIQYAYARICSIFKKATDKPETKNLELLKEPSELGLIKQLIRFPEIVEDTSKDYQTQRIPQYAMDLANSFHLFYQDCKVISEDKKLSQVRLALVWAVKIVLKNTLDLMGISAPEKM